MLLHSNSALCRGNHWSLVFVPVTSEFGNYIVICLIVSSSDCRFCEGGEFNLPTQIAQMPAQCSAGLEPKHLLSECHK